MPKNENAPVGAPCWIELFSSDTDKARAFYGELFGWTSEQMGPEYGGYINFSKDGVRVAGCMLNDGSQGVPDFWTTYLSTDDAQKTCDAAVANGGELHLAPMQVMELGTMAMVADPGGAAVGVWQPASHAGFEVIGEPGAPNWFELQTRDYDGAIAFYRNVFRWDTHTASDTPELRYTILGEGEQQRAGIMDGSAYLPEDQRPFWAIYFGTASTDASLERTVALGGAVVDPAVDTPYGRMATATDPTGTIFKLLENPTAA